MTITSDIVLGVFGTIAQSVTGLVAIVLVLVLLRLNNLEQTWKISIEHYARGLPQNDITNRMKHAGMTSSMFIPAINRLKHKMWILVYIVAGTILVNAICMLFANSLKSRPFLCVLLTLLSALSSIVWSVLTMRQCLEEPKAKDAQAYFDSVSKEEQIKKINESDGINNGGK